MGNEGNANGCHYDLTKSRRTRKPMPANASGRPPDEGAKEDGVQSKEAETKDGMVNRRTLKCLMDGEHEMKRVDIHDHDVGHRKKSLGHHFLEEEHQLALVTKQGGCIEGGNASGMMGHYMKVLNQLIKAKRDRPFGNGKRVIGQLIK